MGVAKSPEIFQQKMNDLFHGFKFICANIYELLLLIKKRLDVSYTEIGINSKQTEVKVLKFNTENYFFRIIDME